MSAAVKGPALAVSSQRVATVAAVVAALLALGTSGVTLVPALHIDAWSTLTLVAAALTSIVLPAPAHACAARLWRTPWHPAVIASVAVLAAWAYSAAVVSQGHHRGSVVAPALAGATLAVTHALRRRADLRLADLPAPWLGPAGGVVLVVAGGITWGLVDDWGRGLGVVVTGLVGLAAASWLLVPSTALLAARGLDDERGVAFASAEAARRLAAADNLVLELDGTITTGALRVTSVDPLEPDHDRNLRWFAGALSHTSDHPISRAVAKLSARGHVSAVEHLPGRGVIGSVDRHPVRVGDPAWLGVEQADGLWRTVAVEVDARVLGTLTVADDVRERAATSVTRLRELGLDVHLVSDARPDRAAFVAAAVGLEAPRPESAASVAAELESAGRTVAVVGSTASGTLRLGPDDDVRLKDCDVERVGWAVAAARALTRGVRNGLAVALAGAAAGVGVALAGQDRPDLTAVMATATAIVAALVSARRPR